METTNHISLDKAPLNACCIICETNDINRRFQDIGIVKGAQITPVFESMFSKARAYLVKGSLFSIRKNIAKEIIVKQDS